MYLVRFSDVIKPGLRAFRSVKGFHSDSVIFPQPQVPICQLGQKQSIWQPGNPPSHSSRARVRERESERGGRGVGWLALLVGLRCSPLKSQSARRRKAARRRSSSALMRGFIDLCSAASSNRINGNKEKVLELQFHTDLRSARETLTFSSFTPKSDQRKTSAVI